MRVEVSADAAAIVRRVRDGGRGELVLILSNGCCESTAPYLYDHYVVEPDAVEVGAIEGVRVMAPRWLADLYPDDEVLTVDVVSGVIEDSFSLETEYDCRFVLRAVEA